MTDPKLRVVPPVPIEEPTPQRERPTFFIPLGELHVDFAANARTRYDDVDGMAAALSTSGQIMPLICVEGRDEHGNPRYELVEGFSRVKSWQKMRPKDWQSVRVEIKVREIRREGDKRLLGFQANMVRRNLRHVEQCREVWELIRKDGYSLKWLAAHSSVSEGKLQIMLKVWGNLCKEVKAEWERSPEGVITFDTIKKWAALPDEDAQRAALKRHMGEQREEEDTQEPEPERARSRPYLSDVQKKWKHLQKKERLSARDEGIRDALAWVVGKGKAP